MCDVENLPEIPYFKLTKQLINAKKTAMQSFNQNAQSKMFSQRPQDHN